MKTRIFLILIATIAILCTSMTMADTETSLLHIGGDDYTWSGGDTKFNSLLTSIPYQKTIGTQSTNLLVQDLDGDGTTEILYLDGATFRTYHFESHSLFTDLAYTLPHTTNSNLAIGDLDGDGYFEISILDTTDNRIIILEYNGTEIWNQTSFPLGYNSPTSVHIECENLICSGVGADSTSTNLMGFVYNSSQILDYEVVKNVGAGSLCFSATQAPLISRTMYWTYFNKGTNTLRLGSFDINASNGIDNVQYVGFGAMPAAIAGGCGALVQVSGPTVADITSDYTGNEIIVTAANDGTVGEFKMYIYDSNFNMHVQSPSVDHLLGQYISEPFIMDIFPVTSGEKEVCTGAHNATGIGDVEILCFSFDKPTGVFIGTASNIFSWDKPYSIANVSSSTMRHMYSLQALDETYQQVLSSYGTLNLDPDSCSIFGNCDMTSSFTFPIAANLEKYVISVDVQESDQQDLIAVTSTKLWYLDDNLENSPAYIDDDLSTINPCVEGVIRINESMLITAVVVDPELNDVSARMQVYYGTTNEQDSGWMTNQSSSDPFSYLFILNKTTNSGKIVVSARDVENNFDTIVTSTHTFTVASQGIEFGDCETYFGTVDPTITPLPSPIPIEPDNAIRQGTRLAAETSGLSEAIIWTILMGLIMWSIVTIDSISSGVKMYALVGITFMGVVVGTMLGIIPVTIVIIGIILIALAAAIAFTLMIGGGK